MFGRDTLFKVANATTGAFFGNNDGSTNNTIPDDANSGPSLYWVGRFVGASVLLTILIFCCVNGYRKDKIPEAENQQNLLEPQNQDQLNNRLA
jgi:hypothetical protein